MLDTYTFACRYKLSTYHSKIRIQTVTQAYYGFHYKIEKFSHKGKSYFTEINILGLFIKYIRSGFIIKFIRSGMIKLCFVNSRTLSNRPARMVNILKL